MDMTMCVSLAAEPALLDAWYALVHGHSRSSSAVRQTRFDFKYLGMEQVAD